MSVALRSAAQARLLVGTFSDVVTSADVVAVLQHAEQAPPAQHAWDELWDLRAVTGFAIGYEEVSAFGEFEQRHRKSPRTVQVALVAETAEQRAFAAMYAMLVADDPLVSVATHADVAAALAWLGRPGQPLP